MISKPHMATAQSLPRFAPAMLIKKMKIKIGSLFSGIGGFELGLERAIEGAQTVWQVEQDSFCQRVLRKHWPNAQIHNDIRQVGKHNLMPIDLLAGGFPCTDLSISGKKEGIHGKKSGLWFEMLRLVDELRPRVVVAENVAAITFQGGDKVIASLAGIGYDCEWIVISARAFGAPHLRRRWFLVAYPNGTRLKRNTEHAISMEKESLTERGRGKINRFDKSGYWKRTTAPEPVIRGMDDGLSIRLDRSRLRALGNAIVPQCSEFIGTFINKSGLLRL